MALNMIVLHLERRKRDAVRYTKNDRLSGTTGDKQMYRILGLSMDKQRVLLLLLLTCTVVANELTPCFVYIPS